MPEGNQFEVPKELLEQKLGRLQEIGETHVRGMGSAGPFTGRVAGMNPVSADQLQVREHAVQYALEISRMNSDGYEATTADQVVEDAAKIEDFLSNGAKEEKGDGAPTLAE